MMNMRKGIITRAVLQSQAEGKQRWFSKPRFTNLDLENYHMAGGGEGIYAVPGCNIGKYSLYALLNATLTTSGREAAAVCNFLPFFSSCIQIDKQLAFDPVPRSREAAGPLYLHGYDKRVGKLANPSLATPVFISLIEYLSGEVPASKRRTAV